MQFHNINFSGEIILSDQPSTLSVNEEREIIFDSLNSNGFEFIWTNDSKKPYSGIFFDGEKKISLYIYVWNITPTYIGNDLDEKRIQIRNGVNNIGFERENTDTEKTILMGIYNCPHKPIIATWDKDNYRNHSQNTCYVTIQELQKGLQNAIYKCWHNCNVYTMTTEYFPIYVSHMTSNNNTELDTSKGNVSRSKFEKVHEDSTNRKTKRSVVKLYERLATVDYTEMKSEAKRRIGQDIFRELLMEKYDCKCALCDITTPSMLRASHIKEWKDSSDFERLDSNNGILLCAHHDALFDKHLLSFEDSGKPRVSNTLTDEECKTLGIEYIPNLKVNVNMLPYLKYNRKKLKE